MSLKDKLAAYFLANVGVWIDGHVIQKIAGSYGGWSARVRDLRKAGMNIENRQRKVDGYTISEYRFLPSQYAEHQSEKYDANTWELRP